MSKTYRPYDPDQSFLLPPALTDWLPDGHLIYFIRDVVNDFDLSAIESVYEREGRGYPPYHPRMMVSVLPYAYCLGGLRVVRLPGGWKRMLHFGYWRRTTRRIFAPYRTFASVTWGNWPVSLCRSCVCV